MSSAKPKILFVYQVQLSFVKKDLDILRSAYEVRELSFRGFLDFFPMLMGICWCDVSFSWFGSIHAFWAVLFSRVLGKRSVVVAGGHDVAKESEIGYGMTLHWWKRWCPLYVFRRSDLVLSVSKSATLECVRNAGASKEKVQLLYHGFDPDIFKPVRTIDKEPVVITIGRINADSLIRKGLDLFVKSARFLPGTSFVLVGAWDDDTVDSLKAIASPNVTLAGVLHQQDLVELCSRAKVYVQVSRHEGFGCSMAEAMLCECIPVVSRKAAIPEVVGDCGIYVDKLSPEDVAEKVREALQAPRVLGKMARARIVNLFPLQKRKEQLIQAIELLLLTRVK